MSEQSTRSILIPNFSSHSLPFFADRRNRRKPSLRSNHRTVAWVAYSPACSNRFSSSNMEENKCVPSKKRVAGREISKDDPGLEDDDCSEPEMGTFKRASEDVIANRRIIKARRLHTQPQPLSSSSNPFAKINLIVPAKLNEESEKTSEKSLPGDETPLMNQGNSKSEHEVTENRLTVDAEKASQDKDVDTKGNTDTTTLDENEKEKNIFDKDAAPSNVLNEESPKGNEDNWGANSVETENKDTGTSIEAARDETVNEGAEREPVTIAEKQGVEHKDKSEPTAPLSSFQQLSSSQNAFTGLSGTFSFGSLSKDGPAFGSGSGSLFGVQLSEKSAFPSFGVGSSINGTNKLFGSDVVNTIKVGGGGSSAPTMQEVSVETGEENEKVVFKADAILFEYINGGWKERGKGELKVDVSTLGAEKARLVMRARGNYRLILNCSLYPDMSLKAMDKRSVTFACFNTPGGDGKDGLTTFALKFRENTVMEEFFKTVMAYKGKNDYNLSKTPENSPKASND